MSDQCAAAETPPLSEVETLRRDLARWPDYCVIEIMIRNRQVDEFVREKEREVEGLWSRIRAMANQTDPAWALKLAKDAIAEREA